MRFTWLRPSEEHHTLGLLRTGETYEGPAEVVRIWINDGAAAPVAAAEPPTPEDTADVVTVIEEQEG